MQRYCQVLVGARCNYNLPYDALERARLDDDCEGVRTEPTLRLKYAP